MKSGSRCILKPPPTDARKFQPEPVFRFCTNTSRCPVMQGPFDTLIDTPTILPFQHPAANFAYRKQCTLQVAFWCFVCPSGLGPLLTTSVAVRLLAFAGVESGLCAERYNNTPTRTACDYVLRTPRSVFFFCVSFLFTYLIILSF